MSSAAVAQCTTKTGDPNNCQTAALLGATDLQLDSVANDNDLESLMMSPGVSGNAMPDPSTIIVPVPDAATYLLSAAVVATVPAEASFLFDSTTMDNIAADVAPTAAGQAVDTSTDAVITGAQATGAAIAAAPAAVANAFEAWLKANIIWVLIAVGVIAIVAAIIINPQGLALAGRAVAGG